VAVSVAATTTLGNKWAGGGTVGGIACLTMSVGGGAVGGAITGAGGGKTIDAAGAAGAAGVATGGTCNGIPMPMPGGVIDIVHPGGM
jgi:hypothetical protein